MTVSVFRVLSRRLRRDERGFTLIEIVMAMGVILLSLTMLATTALVGFKGSATARHRQTATATADAVVEQVRGLSWTTLTQGMKDSDLSGDSNIVGCGGNYCYSGETIVHSSGASTAPLYPHTVTDTSGYTRSVYLTLVAGATNLYRLTVLVRWTYQGTTSNVQTQTLLSHPAGTADSSTQGSAGGSTASFYGTGSVSPGNIVVTPNAAVYNGVGVTGLTSSVWNTGDSVTQTMYGLDANVAQAQTTNANGQSTLTAAKKSISGTVTSSGGSTTLSQADDDPGTSSVGTSSSPAAITQTGPSLTLSGSGNSLGMNQYTVVPPNIQLRNSSSTTANNVSSITLSAPSGTTSGDLLVAEVGIDGNGSITAPSGWTLIRGDTNGAQVQSAVYYRVAGSSESTYAFSLPSGSYAIGGVLAYTGVDTTAPVNVSGASTGNSATATAPSVTTTTAGTRYLGFFVTYRQSVTADSPLASRWGGSTFYAGTGLGGGSNIKTGGAAGGMTLSSAGASGTTTGTMDGSNKWVAQSIALKPYTNTSAPGTETGATVSTTAAAASPSCGSPAQTDGKACAYASQSYTSTNQAFLDTTADLSGYGIGKCVLYTFNPPTSNPTSYAYGHRAATSGDGKLVEDVKRYYGTHTFGQLCAGTGSMPTSWPGYFVKFDAATSASQATAGAGVSAGSPSTTTAGTISVWNGSGTTSISVPTSGTWSTTPTDLDFTTSSNYRYQISSTLGSGSTYTTSTGSSTVTEAKAVVGAPVIGTISYRVTDVTNSRVLIDVTINVDLGSLIAYGKYSAAA